MAAYRRFYDSRHLQADCQEPASAPEPCARQSSGLPFPFFYRLTQVVLEKRPLNRCSSSSSSSVVCKVNRWLSVAYCRPVMHRNVTYNCRVLFLNR